MHLPVFNGIVGGYLAIGAFLLLYPMLSKVETLDGREVTTDADNDEDESDVVGHGHQMTSER
jgi:hypothetical protein